MRWPGYKLRAILYLAALVATRCNSVIAALYRRLLDAGKVKKATLVTCMSKLLTIINAMMRTIPVWNPELTNHYVVAEAKLRQLLPSTVNANHTVAMQRSRDLRTLHPKITVIKYGPKVPSRWHIYHCNLSG